MSQQNPTWDKKDFLAATDVLRAEAANLEAVLSAAGKNVPARPTLTTSAINNFDAMTAHMAKLRAMVAVSISPGAVSSAHAATAAPQSNHDRLIASATQAQRLAATWDPDARIAAARERADDDDKPSDEKAGNCEACSGSGRCKSCDGSGKKPGSSEYCANCEGDGRCPECNGNGSTKEEKAGGQNGKAAFNPDAALLRARGAKSVSDLNAMGPTPFARD